LRAIIISGAGIAGMTAAKILAQGGRKAIIYEKQKTVGASRNGDFEGLENWIFQDSGSSFFESHGFKWENLSQQSYCTFSIHTHESPALVMQSDLPFFHIIQRGRNDKSIDRFLFKQCLQAGIEFKFGIKGPENADIIATGTKKAAAYIRGLTFSTPMDNQVHLLLGRRYAPDGYAYLIILNGKGTLATAFKKSEKFNDPLGESINYFKVRGYNIPSGNSFASRGSFSIPVKTFLNKPYYIGESGGIQDYLFGFGMRLAMASGKAAAYKILGREQEAQKLFKDIKRKQKISYIQRLVYEKLSDQELRKAAEKMSSIKNPLGILSSAYNWNFKRIMEWLLLKGKIENSYF